MRCSTSRFPSLVAIGLVVALVRVAPARAQACCAGASTLTPTRLTDSEAFAVGLRLRGSAIVGSFDAFGAFSPSPAGATETDLGEDLFAVARWRERFQLGLLVPVEEALRAVPGLTDAGGGVGDVQLSGRWDLRTVDDSQVWPALALLAGASLPTGTPVEAARHPLATDATGLGSATGLVGLQLEKASGHLLFDLVGTVTGQLPRTASGVTQRYGADLNVALAAGWAFDSGLGLALVGAFRHQGEAEVDGRTVPESALSVGTVGLSGGAYVADAWRVQGSLTLPVAAANAPASPALALAVVRSWM